MNKPSISDASKQRNIISAKHPAVVLMLRKMHEGNHLEGTDYVRSLVQQQFRVIGPRNALRSIKSKCVRCRTMAVQSVHPHMADLRKERVEGNVYPFKTTTVEYFGPFDVTVLRRPVNYWCCLFACLVTTAVHIEVVNALDTDA